MNYSIVDASNDFACLSNSIGRFKENLCEQLGIDPTSQDFRLVCLDSIQQLLLSATAYIRAFAALQGRVFSPQEFIQILNIGPYTPESLERSRLIYKYPIESLLTMSHFRIDSLLGQICCEDGRIVTGFYRRVEAVLAMTNLTNEAKEDAKNTLICLSLFRNSFHNSGRHKKNLKNSREMEDGSCDRIFDVEGYRLEFRHNELITYDWKIAFVLLERSVVATEQIIESLYVNCTQSPDRHT